MCASTLATPRAEASPAAFEDVHTKAARRHQSRGRALHEESLHADAITEFEIAPTVLDLPALDYNLALCEERLEHWSRAAELYGRPRHVGQRPVRSRHGAQRGDAPRAGHSCGHATGRRRRPSGMCARERSRSAGGLAPDAKAGKLPVAARDDCLVPSFALATSTVKVVAGSAAGSLDAIGGAARFHHPTALALDGLGNLYVADTGNATLRVVRLATKQVDLSAGQVDQGGVLLGAAPAARTGRLTGLAHVRKENALLLVR